MNRTLIIDYQLLVDKSTDHLAIRPVGIGGEGVNDLGELNLVLLTALSMLSNKYMDTTGKKEPGTDLTKIIKKTNDFTRYMESEDVIKHKYRDNANKR